MIDLFKFYTDTYDDLFEDKSLRHKITTYAELKVFLKLDSMYQIFNYKRNYRETHRDEEDESCFF